MLLSDRDRDFLAWLRGGDTAAAYAREHGFGPDWAKWKSREVRRKLGVETLGEAVAMTDDNGQVSRAEFDKLVGMFASVQEAIEELAAAKPDDKPDAQSVVQQRELSLKDHAKALGLSVADVEKLQGEKKYSEFKAMQERLAKEKAEEAAAFEDEEEGESASLGERIRDGLGGIRNVQR